LRCGNLQHRAIGLPAERRFGTKRHQRLDGAARTAERLVLKRRRHAEQRQQHRAIDIAPATSPATPATRISCDAAVAAATPTMRLDVEISPSLAPSTAARSQPIRSMSWLSLWTARMASPISADRLWLHDFRQWI